MATTQNLFSAQGSTISIAATAAASTPVPLPVSCSAVRITNEGPNVAFVAIAAASTAATLPTGTAAQTCTPILASSDVTLSVAGGPGGAQQYVSAICRAAGTAVLTVQCGEGI